MGFVGRYAIFYCFMGDALVLLRILRARLGVCAAVRVCVNRGMSSAASMSSSNWRVSCGFRGSRTTQPESLVRWFFLFTLMSAGLVLPSLILLYH